MNTLLRLALLALFLQAPTGLAQQSAESTVSEQEPVTDTSEEQAAATTEEEEPGPAVADSSTPAPGDYRASEDISDDLPVSFPIDI